jgi:hypothetical protein
MTNKNSRTRLGLLVASVIIAGGLIAFVIALFLGAHKWLLFLLAMVSSAGWGLMAVVAVLARRSDRRRAAGAEDD